MHVYMFLDHLYPSPLPSSSSQTFFTSATQLHFLFFFSHMNFGYLISLARIYRISISDQHLYKG